MFCETIPGVVDCDVNEDAGTYPSCPSKEILHQSPTTSNKTTSIYLVILQISEPLLIASIKETVEITYIVSPKCTL